MLKLSSMRVVIVSLFLVIVAVLGVFLAARNVINKPNTSQIVIKACNLVTLGELGDVMGAVPVTEEKPEQGGSICIATTDDKLLTVHVQNSVGIKNSYDESIASASDYYEQQLSGVKAPEIIEGVGDRAFWDGSQVGVLEGDYVVNIVYDNRDKTLNLVKKLLPRLKP